MKIKIDTIHSFDFKLIVEQSPLTSDEKEQITHLFQKIKEKEHLKEGSSSRLEYLIGKLNSPHISLIPSDKKHSFVLKVDLIAQNIQPINIHEVNKRSGNYDKTPLQLAINSYNIQEKEGSLNKIRELIQNEELDINYTDREGWSAAYQVTQLIDKEALELVLSHPQLRINAKNVDGSTPLIRAADRNNTIAMEAILKLKEVKLDHSNDVGTALMYAARKGHTDIVRMLLEAGAKPNQVSDCLGKTALRLAKEGGYEETARLLEEKGATEETPPSELQKIVQAGADVLKVHLKDNVNLKDEYGRTAAHYWAHSPTEEVKELLMNLGANFEVEDRFKRTPIHYAAMQGNTEAISFLIQQKVDVNHQDKLKYTPLFWIAQYDRAEAGQELINNQADLLHKDKFGWTSLEKAAENNSKNVCALLATLTDVNRQAPDGRTALHKAAINCSFECILILKQHGAQVDIPDQNNKKPFDHLPSHATNEIRSTLSTT